MFFFFIFVFLFDRVAHFNLNLLLCILLFEENAWKTEILYRPPLHNLVATSIYMFVYRNWKFYCSHFSENAIAWHQMVYGGKVLDNFDRRIVYAYLDEYLGDFLFDSFQPFRFYCGDDDGSGGNDNDHERYTIPYAATTKLDFLGKFSVSECNIIIVIRFLSSSFELNNFKLLQCLKMASAIYLKITFNIQYRSFVEQSMCFNCSIFSSQKSNFQVFNADLPLGRGHHWKFQHNWFVTAFKF